MFNLMGPIERVPVAPPPLHAPDGFFSGPVIVLGWAVAAVAIALSLRMTGRRLNERLVPAMGVFAAFVFAAQMLNFPVAGGTSGHMVGAALLAIVLGPWAAILVMTSVVMVQALLFQDGGLIVLGANLMNIAVLPSLTGYAIYATARRYLRNARGLLIVGFVAAWTSVEVSAAAAAVGLAWSGTSPLAVALPAILGIHALVGIGEGLITAGALAVIRNARRDLLQLGGPVPGREAAH